MANLILVMGLPGSGKTTFAQTLEGHKLHIDEFRKTIAGTYVSGGENDGFVYKMVQEAVEHYLEKGKTVVVDGAFLSARARAPYIKIAKKHQADIEVFWLDVPFDMLQERISERNKNVDDERKISMYYIGKLSRMLEIPTVEEGIDDIHHLSEEELF